MAQSGGRRDGGGDASNAESQAQQQDGKETSESGLQPQSAMMHALKDKAVKKVCQVRT